tara:strand:+ start:2398 stop:4155 length:1758 start_codon:yes stop_codon:yes gene_type:complete
MTILKLLNKKHLSIVLIFLILGFSTQAEDPIDIWSTDGKKTLNENISDKNSTEESIQENSIYEMQSQKKNSLGIEQDQTLTSKEIKIVGLYDPAENGLTIDMWSNSDGGKILKLVENINKINLSKDASEILDILLLTNSYYPKKNITKEQFLEIKSNWLIKNSDLKLIENYLLNNQIVNDNPKLTKYLVDEYLSRSEVKKSCEIFAKIKGPINDDYLSKFNIYCLIYNNKTEEAQLLLDLKKELGFKDKFYEKKIEYLMGYDESPNIKISEETILDFHLSHRVNLKFKFEPKNTTSKKIWKYLSTSNLLGNIKDVELTDLVKISTIEKATHEKNYSEKELYKLYKRFPFNINQLLNIKESSKLISTIEARALIYQGILITTETDKKLELMNALKNSFINDGIGNAFDQEMRSIFDGINEDEIPSNYTRFFDRYNKLEIASKNIKINNKILHQSKLINYFKEDASYKNIQKDINDFLKKIKKDKKYYFSMNDVILVEALKSDEVKVSEKYNKLYSINDSQVPSDIQEFIRNNDMGNALLRIVEVIGQDNLRDIDPETMYFIISTLNQLDIDPLRNKILLKILPLKV